MKPSKMSACRKSDNKKISFDLKLSLVSDISNGNISVNHASKIYGIARPTIDYWVKKLSTYENKRKFMNKDEEIKKLKKRIEELEFVKEFQQDMIAEFEKVTGEELSKKYLPEHLVKEIQKKKKKLSK